MNFIPRLFLFLWLLLLAIHSSSAQDLVLDVKFKHLTTDMGLSQRSITAIYQDRKGYIWIGTQNGLNRYDGYQFKVYKNERGNPKTIGSNRVSSIVEDREGNVWIGTLDAGVSRYNRKTDSFETFMNEPENPNSLSNDGVLALCVDDEDNLWIGTFWGLNCYNKKTNSFKQFHHDENNQNCLSENTIYKIIIDKKGILWIGTTSGGLMAFDKKASKFTRFQHGLAENDGLLSNDIRFLFEDSKGNIWIATDKGVNIYDTGSQTFRKFTESSERKYALRQNQVVAIAEDALGRIWMGTVTAGIDVYDPTKDYIHYNDVLEDDPFSMKSVAIACIYKDKNKNLWVGTSDNGIGWVNWNEKKFRGYSKRPLDDSTLGNNYVSGFLQDKKGEIWVGTGIGLDVFSPTDKSFYHFSKELQNYQPYSGNIFASTSMVVDRNDNIWIGTWGNGVTMLSHDRFNFKQYRHEEGNPNSLSSNYVKAIALDKEGNVFIGTIGYGLSVLNPKSNSFTHYRHNFDDTTTLSSDYIGALMFNSDGVLYIGTEGGGLNIFDKKSKTFKRFLHDKNDPNSISSHLVSSLFEDSKKRIWVGTYTGLNLFDPIANKFTTYEQKDKFQGNNIKAIQEDDKGNLWISTNNGITRFHPEKLEARNYTKEDGLISSEFHTNSLRSASGDIYFGSANGFNTFHPDSIVDNTVAPPVYITNFQIFNKNVPIDSEGSPLKQHISETRELTLSYKESVLTFEFAALNFSSPELNQYAYKLEGFDMDWNRVGNKRAATYTNLDPGKYVLRVKASNNDGVWNDEGVSLAITITPPYWETIWFRVFAILLFVGIAFTWYNARINNIEKQKIILESQVKERTSELVVANGLLVEQKEEIISQREKLEKLYLETKDSIRAAQIIQKFIFPSETLIKQYLPEIFILNKPKDGVSGDFYWFDAKGDEIIIASVDCTGHGVSGALMSVNGYHLLNQAIHPYEKLVASEILNRLNDGVIKALHQHKDNDDVQDGMDISLCIINTKTKKLQYSGANSPLYLIRNNNIIIKKGNKFPIGLVINGLSFKFTNHEIQLEDGDKVYMFSDGYADQIGGANGTEKLMYTRFRDLLINISDMEMSQQLLALDEYYSQWKGENEQLDDVLMIGFKV